MRSNFLLKNLMNLSRTNPIEKVYHIPVLASKILEIFAPNDGQIFLDMTFGGGGHTKALLSTGRKITVLALDRDPEAFERALVLSRKVSAQNNGQKVIPLLCRFSQIEMLFERLKFPRNFLDGVVMDLGASTFQYENGDRGFSLSKNGPLNMRMDGNLNPQMPTAADVINTLDANELALIFKAYGEEKHAMKIAQAIIDSRFMMKRINTSKELAEMIRSTLINCQSTTDKIGRSIHPATKIFQAIRIFVNNELNELYSACLSLSRLLKSQPKSGLNFIDSNQMIVENRTVGGLLAIISFHSLEDRIVKNFFSSFDSNVKNSRANNYDPFPSISSSSMRTISFLREKESLYRFYQTKLIVPSDEEILMNPKSRSAKLRIGLRIQ
ncbi:putative methyltransferase-like protein 15 [Sarcoptes scabiei]|uniref:Methyltransferase-like protein 15-like protein n=1 Tax=Sarcoptes scabiei TaxID=52283 RepID=A0A131ZTJ6_SARSC|nr:putative methyltransferase-like protein 15 [Sarcoptes scabiei]KPM01605.1 methyltransferase-like protein 15-like protein [Sarcoptes scabiei]